MTETEAGRTGLSLLGRVCGRSSLAFPSLERLLDRLRGPLAEGLSAARLMAVVQALPEMDDVYTPVMKRGTKESRWQSVVTSRLGMDVTVALQRGATRPACVLGPVQADGPPPRLDRGRAHRGCRADVLRDPVPGQRLRGDGPVHRRRHPLPPSLRVRRRRRPPRGGRPERRRGLPTPPATRNRPSSRGARSARPPGPPLAWPGPRAPRRRARIDRCGPRGLA